ncbi:MAG: transcriptional regulator [Pseudomonadota bacterium]
MPSSRLAFGPFVLDPDNRQLRRGDRIVHISSRYFDALALLLRGQGRLVTKDRFHEEVWKGRPVTDEAITQCVRTLRKQLGDDASRPQFIETVPKHGYRFVAPVERIRGSDPTAMAQTRAQSEERFVDVGAACTLGGGIAGLVGGLLYGAAAALEAPHSGVLSTLLVVASMTILVAAIGGAGVGFGIAAARFSLPNSWLSSAAGGAMGGLVVGASVKTLGIDSFNLFFGQSPGDITGGGEGAVLGGAIGVGVWLATHRTVNLSSVQRVATAAFSGATAGALIALFGGRLMVGSLELLARQFAGSRLRFDRIGQWFGEEDFGSLTQAVIGGLEGALFAACIVGAAIITLRRRAS